MASHQEPQNVAINFLEYLERLETFPATQVPGESTRCCICLERMQYVNNAHNTQVIRAVQIHDQHHCCQGCLTNWAERSNSCPLCRQPLFAEQNNGESLELRLDDYMRKRQPWGFHYTASGRMVETPEDGSSTQVFVDSARASMVLFNWWWSTFTAINRPHQRRFIHHPVASALLFDMLSFIKKWAGDTRGLHMQRFCGERSMAHRVTFWRDAAKKMGDDLPGLDDYVEDLIEAAAQAVVLHHVQMQGIKYGAPEVPSSETEAWIERLPQWHLREKVWSRCG